MSRLGSQHGYILLPVVILLTLVAGVAFMVNHESALDSGITSSQLEATQADYVARAGLNHGLWLARQQGCGPFTDLSNQPLDNHSYTTTLTSGLGSTTAYTLAVDQDTWIRSDQPTDNKAADGQLHIRFETGIIERPMYRYDVSPIPADASILSATAWFYVSAAHPEGPVDIHLLNADWTETGATWDSMGANMDPAVQASIPTQPVPGVWVPVNLTAQVQAWVKGSANFGITLNSVSEGTHGDYASIEAAQKPYLEVIVGTPESSANKLTSKATLASGITRTLNLISPGLYQQTSHLFLQPDAADGKDAWLTADKTTWNFGKAGYLRVRAGGGGHWRSPVQFAIERVPRGAQIRSASLELYRFSGTQDAAGLVNVHAINRSWVEGDNNGGTGPGVTWDLRDLSLPWNTAGGDFDAAPSASIPIDASADTWYSADVTSLVQQWVNGSRDNHGIMLVAGDNGVRAEFRSSDEADPTLRPKLTIRYACECGSPCMTPQGTGTVLMVVINPTTLVPMDAYKKALFESWGYTVAVVGESANQASYDAAMAAADVVFISETVNANQVGTKLQDVALAVVSQDGIYNDDLGIASGSAFTVGSAINVTDTSHYITAVFPTGALEIYNGVMQQLIVSGGTAPDLQTLANTAGAGSLVVLDKGAIGTGGAPLAGRRVMLPLGRDANFNWDYLNANGRLLLHRALQWGMGADLALLPPKNLLFVSGGSVTGGDPPVTPTAQEQLRIDLIESWGYTVTLIHASQSQADFDAALSDKIVAYVSSAVLETDLGTKLKDAATGIVNEQGTLVDEFGFGAPSVSYKTRNEIDVIDNTHYITEAFSTGLLGIVSADQQLHFMTSNKAAGFTALARVFNTGSLWDDAMGIIESGGELFGGGSAAGRRALLPWGDASFDVSALNTDGLTLMQRTIDWAAGIGGGPSTNSTFWVATLNDVSASGAPGLADWSDGEVLAFSDPDLALEPATTNGSFSSVLNLDSFASDGNAEIHGLHFVDSDITVGGANSVTLQPGDVLVTTAASETLTSNNNITVNNEDVFVFRPAIAGDYSAGDFIYLLDGSQLHAEADTVAISLIEKDTTAGDAFLTAGTFLFAATNRRDVLAFVADDVGPGTTSGTVTELVDGSDVSLDSEIRGLDLAEDAVLVGGHLIPDGGILLTLNNDGGFSGDNGIATDSEDIFYLVMTQTGASSIGDATLLFDGSDVNLDTGDEHLQALTLTNSVTGGGGGTPPPGPGGIVFEEFTDAKTNGATNLTINKPPGTVAGDLLIAALVTDDDTTGTMAPPPGWNLVDLNKTGSAVTFGVWWKLATASESGSYTFSWGASEKAFGMVMRISGHDPVNPIHVSDNDGGSSSAPVSPAVTTTVADTMILRLGGFDDDDITVGAPGLAGHTAITMDESGSGNGTSSAGAGYTLQAAAGSSGTSSFALTASEQYRTVTIAIAPAP